MVGVEGVELDGHLSRTISYVHKILIKVSLRLVSLRCHLAAQVNVLSDHDKLSIDHLQTGQ